MKCGITGHQDIGVGRTEEFVERALEEAVTACSVTRGLSCLARGADQLFAAVLIRHRVPLTAVIPCAGYEETFSTSEAQVSFQRCLTAAADVVRLPFSGPSEQAYFEAGKYVATNCGLLIAVWDGQPARGLGGTADIVLYAQSIGRRILQVNPVTRMVTSCS